MKFFIRLDEKSRQGLDDLGKISGTAAIDANDVISPKGKAILQTLPLTTNTAYGLKDKTTDAPLLEEIRQFANRTNTHKTVWAAISLDGNGHVAITAAKDHVACTRLLLQNPRRMHEEIQREATYKTELPEAMATETAAKTCGSFVIGIRAISSTLIDNPKMPLDEILETKPDAIKLYYATLHVMQMVELSQSKNEAEKKTACNFLKELSAISEKTVKSLKDYNWPEPVEFAIRTLSMAGTEAKHAYTSSQQ